MALVFIGVVGTFFAMIAYPDPVFLATMLLPLTLRAIALNDIKSVPDWIGDLERNGLRILTWFMDGLVGILTITAFVLMIMREAENRRRSVLAQTNNRTGWLEPLFDDDFMQQLYLDGYIEPLDYVCCLHEAQPFRSTASRKKQIPQQVFVSTASMKKNRNKKNKV
eukprot:GHVO01049793.1.p2 GENE.GHVO01049793.1~~GHVO01049793.1.p2  ORF type:complete len:166 (-),score=9.05 GHVO01049793.1:399-896(-)